MRTRNLTVSESNTSEEKNTQETTFINIFFIVGNIREKYICCTVYFELLSHSDPFDTSNDHPLKHSTH